MWQVSMGPASVLILAAVCFATTESKPNTNHTLSNQGCGNLDPEVLNSAEWFVWVYQTPASPRYNCQGAFIHPLAVVIHRRCGDKLLSTRKTYVRGKIGSKSFDIEVKEIIDRSDAPSNIVILSLSEEVDSSENNKVVALPERDTHFEGCGCLFVASARSAEQTFVTSGHGCSTSSFIHFCSKHENPKLCEDPDKLLVCPIGNDVSNYVLAAVGGASTIDYRDYRAPRTCRARFASIARERLWIDWVIEKINVKKSPTSFLPEWLDYVLFSPLG